VVGVVVACAAIASPPANALELFGVSVLDDGSGQDIGLVYSVTLKIEGDSDTLEPGLSQASLLVTQSEKGAPDAFALVARARGDVERLIAALYAEARYGANVEITIGGIPLDQVRPSQIEATSGAPVAVNVHIKPGPVFRFGTVAIEQSVQTETTPPTAPGDYALVVGEPAKSALVIVASDKLVEAWRSVGYPFAEITKKDIVADHERSVLNVRYLVTPGKPAVYGWILGCVIARPLASASKQMLW
jgi:translocation and assembly module TamA